MNSSISKNTFKAIYRLLDKVSPLDDDCGLLCGAACCTCDNCEGADAIVEGASDDADYEMGIYLLPGEEQMFDGDEDWIKWGHLAAEEFDFPDSWYGDVHFLECKAAPCCPREKRPLQCRFYPLTPHIDEDGKLWLIYQNAELPYTCPLIESRIPLNRSFMKATYTVWCRLIQDSLILDMVLMDSQYRIEDQTEIIKVFPPAEED